MLDCGRYGKLAKLGSNLEGALTMRTDSDIERAAASDQRLLAFDVSDDALERAVPGIDGQITLVFGTAIIGNCGCPCERE